MVNHYLNHYLNHIYIYRESIRRSKIHPFPAPFVALKSQETAATRSETKLDWEWNHRLAADGKNEEVMSSSLRNLLIPKKSNLTYIYISYIIYHIIYMLYIYMYKSHITILKHIGCQFGIWSGGYLTHLTASDAQRRTDRQRETRAALRTSMKEGVWITKMLTLYVYIYVCIYIC
jgi:hypothetical protein